MTAVLPTGKSNEKQDLVFAYQMKRCRTTRRRSTSKGPNGETFPKVEPLSLEFSERALAAGRSLSKLSLALSVNRLITHIVRVYWVAQAKSDSLHSPAQLIRKR